MIKIGSFPQGEGFELKSGTRVVVVGAPGYRHAFFFSRDGSFHPAAGRCEQQE